MSQKREHRKMTIPGVQSSCIYIKCLAIQVSNPQTYNDAVYIYMYVCLCLYAIYLINKV